MKLDYNPAQRSGVNSFEFFDEAITIIYPKGFVERLNMGQILMIQCDNGLFWSGRVYPDAFMFLLEVAIPGTVEDVFDYIRAAHRVKHNHVHAEFVTQQELPF